MLVLLEAYQTWKGTLALFPNKTSELRVKNDKRPNLIIWKRDADTGEVVPNTVFLVKSADGKPWGGSSSFTRNQPSRRKISGSVRTIRPFSSV